MRTIVIQTPEQLIERVHRRLHHRLHLLLAQYETERVVLPHGFARTDNRLKPVSSVVEVSGVRMPEISSYGLCLLIACRPRPPQ